MKLYIMRHGETDWNRKGLMQGSMDIPLNEYGVRLAEQTRDGFVKEGIRFDRAYTSPYLRAKKTAEIILAAQKGVPLIPDPDIREIGFGKYEGIQIGELRTNPEYRNINLFFDDPEHYIREGEAESYGEVFDRVGNFLEQTILPLEQTCEHVLVVCHGATIRAMLSVIRRQPLTEFWSNYQPNCSVNIVRLKSQAFFLEQESVLYYEPETSCGADSKRRFV